MKLIYAIIFVFILNSVHAQQVFQGSVVYNLHVPQEKNDAELLILYGPNKIKIKFKEKEDYDKTYLLIDLDASKFFIVNSDEKTFQIKRLAEKITEENLPSKTIAGHTTIPVSMSSATGLGAIFGVSGTTVLFTAPDLYFPIPKKHAGIPELTMIQDDHIVLGADISMGSQNMGDKLPDSILQLMKVSVEATRITPEVFNTAEFSIPLDFKEQITIKENEADLRGLVTDSTYDPSLDSIAVMPDTTAIMTPKTNQQEKSKPSTPKKTTPTKTEAIKPRKTQTKS